MLLQMALFHSFLCQATNLFQGLWRKELPEVDMQRLMEHCWGAQLSLVALLGHSVRSDMVLDAMGVCVHKHIPLVWGYDIPTTMRRTDSTSESNLCSLYM